jgi:hypothetical protein
MLWETLRRVRTAHDVTAVFQELGYAPDHCPFDERAWLVARWHGLRVVAVDGDDVRVEASKLAKQLGNVAFRGLAVAVNAGEEMALAAPRIGAPGISRVLTVPLREPNPVAIQHLMQFRPRKSATGLAHAMRLNELLATEIVGERFFKAIQTQLDRMAASLDRRIGEDDRRILALLSMTRVLFLYFVQAKGWLDGRTDYLRTLLDDRLAAGSSFHETALEPLCFETLNRPAAERGRHTLGNIPYLNGGLFERHPVEVRAGKAAFPNEIWRDAFGSVFEKFRFCVREAHEVDSIAPDMLGQVFERVMETGFRHATGTFYTPESVVNEMVLATIETALSTEGVISTSLARRIVHHEQLESPERKTAKRCLWRLRILDPAVGSGAYLLGALERLTEMHTALTMDSDDPAARVRLRRRILRDNLFGVDLNPTAVRLAELRLWLAIVSDDPCTDIGAVEPLPNLDGIVRQGDSLTDPIAAAVGTTARGSTKLANDVRTARRNLYTRRGSKRQQGLRILRERERKLALALLESRQRALRCRLRELRAAAEGRNLFGQRSGLTRHQSATSRILRRQLTEMEAAQIQIRDGTIPFFSYEVHAPDVCRDGGFSVVVGNPPWVRAERLPRIRREALRERFTWWRADRSGRGYKHQPDLSVAFLQRAFELAAPGAAIGLLMPSKVATAAYGHAARYHLLRESTVRYVHRVHETDAARFAATTYPLALVVKKERPPREHKILLQFDGANAVKQASLGDTGPWLLVPDRMRSALTDFRESGRALSELASPALGVKTGANDVFVGEPISLGESVVRLRTGGGEVEIEQALVRPIVRGRDVLAFGASAPQVMIWAYDAQARPLPKLPGLAGKYFRRHTDRLLARADHRTGPPWSVFRLAPSLSAHRVVWPDISKRPRAAVLDATQQHNALPMNSCYISAAPNRETALAIAAVLNSTWTAVLTSVMADEARGGYRRVNARAMAGIPIPGGDALLALANLSLQIHNGKPLDQDELDDAVASALHLSARTQSRLRQHITIHR